MITILWLILAVILIVVEIVTPSAFGALWFAIGAFASVAASIIGFNLLVQIIVFFVFSLLAIVLTKPAIMRKKREKTNFDRIIGKKVTVSEEIDNVKGTGRVAADGTDWLARSSDGRIIPSGVVVRVESIEGVKLVVREKGEE